VIKSLKTRISEKNTKITTLNENLERYHSNINEISKEKENLKVKINNLEKEFIEKSNKENEIYITKSIFLLNFE
jgi:uncharacterized coiled-coil DUF342 family protein